MYKKFFIINTALVGSTLLAHKFLNDKRKEKMYKSTRAFDLAMRTLRSNKAAVHFLGESIEDGTLRVIEEKKEDNFTTYHVKVDVRGDLAIGCMNFWLRRTDEEPDVDLTKIVLQIQNIKNALLIFEGNMPTDAKEEIPVS